MAGGYRSLLAPWLGGVSAPSQGGYHGLLAPWIGGAAAPSTTGGGYRGLLAFWMGGASVAASAATVSYNATGRLDYQLAWERLHKRRRDALRVHRDDNEILELLSMFTGHYDC